MSRFLLLPALLCATFLRADDVPLGPDGKPVFGHSTHGDAFDEGPRQAAVLLEGMGSVDFPITTTNAEAQKFFNQGVAQLHGFWYYEAERSFRQAALFDATSPMPYWGMAMSNINNDKRAAEFIKQAVKLREKASPRERLYLDGLSAYYADSKKDKNARRTALVKSLETIVFDFPDDLEAKAFLMFQVWDNAQKGIPISSKTALAALAAQVFAKNPMHPGAHHYIIHLWNNEDDRRALKSAALGGQAAPGVAHLWHMPGHTFTKLRRYADAAWQQEAAARTDHAYMISSKLLPEQIHNYAHNNDWLVENLGFIGRVNDAIDLAKNMIELPRLAPGHKLVGKDGYREARGGYQMGQKRLVDALLAWERWDDLLALDGGAYLPPVADPVGEAKRLQAIGIAAFQKNDKARGTAKLEALRKLIANTKQERTTKADQAESEAKTAKKPADQIAKAIADALLPFIQRSEEIEKLVSELEIYRALTDGRKDDARKALEKFTDTAKVRLSRLHQQAGNDAKALQFARDAVNGGQDQVLPLANLADILWQGGRKKEALDTFRKLRPLCAQADIDQPVFTRLQPVIDELKLPADWRPKLEWAKDTGVRPDIASLGPFRWHPYPATDWSLPDQNAKTQLFTEFKGKPILMLFYLGSGCSHCIEQLNAFGPMAKEFEAAGIKLVAVSTEKAADLHKTFAQAKGEEGFPFPIVADETLATFKAYRAFDDFERMPLHGTFLIDANGLVRWQDISFQPFSDAKWLLAESKRLLALPPQATAKALTAGPTGGKQNGSN
jgi:peroxiredoxin